jgi:CheY-like chemotaxis protein
MPKVVRNITVIGYVLGLLYLSSLLVYVSSVWFPDFQFHAVVIAVLYGLLAFCAVMTVQLREWARRLLVQLNAAMCFYLLVLSARFPDLVHPSYIFMHIIAVLFFIQRPIKAHFQSGWKAVRKSILVVDDDQGVLKAVQGILLANGYSVLTATTGEKGVQIARLQKPDLILLDVILPGIKGREVCARIKEDENARKIPVIFLTAKDSPDDIRAERDAGGLSHLTKPVNAKILLAEIKRVLG